MKNHMMKRRRHRRRGWGRPPFSLSRYFRKKYCDDYPERFIQEIDYKEIDHHLFKYEMMKDREVTTTMYGFGEIDTEFFKLTSDGIMTIRAGYRWDGPSGPTVDTPSFMRSSAVHDVCFQIMREGLIPDSTREGFFRSANYDLKSISRKDGMLKSRSCVVKFSVDKFGRKHTLKEVA